MRSIVIRTAAAVALLIFVAGGSASAQTQTVFAYSSSFGAGATTLITDQGSFGWLDRGWVSSEGLSSASNTNYITGRCDAEGCFGDGSLHRSYFLFDLANLGVDISTATLRVYNPGLGIDAGDGFYSPNPTELLLLSFLDPSWYDDTQSDHVGNVGFYGALAGGTLMGSRLFSASDNGVNVDITLNAAAIASINNARGQLWGLGGCLDGVNCDGPASTVPEPATMTLLATGLAGMAAARRRKRN